MIDKKVSLTEESGKMSLFEDGIAILVWEETLVDTRKRGLLKVEFNRKSYVWDTKRRRREVAASGKTSPSCSLIFSIITYAVASLVIVEDETPLVASRLLPEESKIDWLSAEKKGGMSL